MQICTTFDDSDYRKPFQHMEFFMDIPKTHPNSSCWHGATPVEPTTFGLEVATSANLTPAAMLGAM